MNEIEKRITDRAQPMLSPICIDGDHAWCFEEPCDCACHNPICRVCGCTNEHACDGGCSWVDIDLCSKCSNQAIGSREKL